MREGHETKITYIVTSPSWVSYSYHSQALKLKSQGAITTMNILSRIHSAGSAALLWSLVSLVILVPGKAQSKSTSSDAELLEAVLRNLS